MNRLKKSELTKEIGLRLSVARKSANYKSARLFAIQNNIPTSTYAQHESGKRGIDADTLFYYADLLNLNPSWLLTGSGVPYRSQVEDIDKQMEVLYRELKNVSPLLSETQTYHKIDMDKYAATVNMPVFTDIFKQVWEAFLDKSELKLSWEDFVEGCIDIYNNVVHINDPLNRASIIDLSIDSFKRGSKSN